MQLQHFLVGGVEIPYGALTYVGEQHHMANIHMLEKRVSVWQKPAPFQWGLDQLVGLKMQIWKRNIHKGVDADAAKRLPKQSLKDMIVFHFALNNKWNHKPTKKNKTQSHGRKREYSLNPSPLPAMAARCNYKWVCKFSELTDLLWVVSLRLYGIPFLWEMLWFVQIILQSH